MAARSIASVIFAVSLLVGFPPRAFSGPLEDGEAAYNQGYYAKALQIWKPLADQGNPHAQSWVGYILENGKGVPVDKVAAAQWYRLAAEQEFPVAQYNLGLCYLFGTGVAQDEAEALRWFRNAAKNGDADAE